MWSSKSNSRILPKQALHIRRRRRCPSSPSALNTLPLSPPPTPSPSFFSVGHVSPRFSDFSMTTKHCFLPSEGGKSIVFLPIELGRFWMKFRGIEPRVASLIDLFLRCRFCVSACPPLLFVFVCVSLLSYSSCGALLLRANADPWGSPRSSGVILFIFRGSFRNISALGWG